MRKLVIILVAVLLIPLLIMGIVSRVGAGTRVYGFHEIENTDGKAGCGFSIGDFKAGYHIGPCGFGRAVNWSYTIFCSGAGDRFAFDKVDVMPVGLGNVKPVGGDVVVDRQKKRVIISLRVAQGAGEAEFVGNGTFAILERP
jgi:hypothetical protein